MNILERFVAEPLQTRRTSRSFAIPEDTKQGLTLFEDIMVVRNGDAVTAYDRRCDHNGGKLVSQPGTNIASCPLHGWMFDAESGAYTNVAVRKTPLTVVKTDKGFQAQIDLFTPLLDNVGDQSVSIRFINHACVVVSFDGLSFATDPWLLGPAFCNGWWLKYKSPSDALDIVNQCDFIFISHNHPDHLHPETLAQIRKDMPVLTAGFATRSAESYVRDLGFANVLAADFGSAYHDPISGLRFTVLKSGDFRDDSGLYFTIGAFSGLLTVDCNHLNFNMLPAPVTFLASSFSGGASGFPLCFTNLELTEKLRVLARNRNAMIAGVKRYIEVSKPSVYMPYAGYFAEDPVRDEMVATNNLKNQPSDYLSLCRDSNTILADPTVEDTYVFSGDKLVKSYQSKVREIGQPDRNYYTHAWKKFGDISFEEVASYFMSSGFRDNLIAYIGLSDEDFVPRQIYRVDFRATPPSVELCDPPQLQKIHNETGARVTYAHIRTPAFVETIRDLLPWEDLFIGFQARFDRVPNVYDSDFWYHFTNVHIKQRARRAISDCGGGCSRIGEAVF